MAATQVADRQSAAILTGKTMSLAAGTSSQAPMTYTAGTLLTTPANGSVEYDGVNFYTTVNSASRGVTPTMFMALLTSATTLSNATGVQAIFPAANDTLALQSGTTYLFEAMYIVSSGATAHSTNIAFGGTAVLASIMYHCVGTPAVNNVTPTSGANCVVTTAASTAVTVSGTSQNGHLRLEGIIRVTTAGTLIPQIAYSVAPGSTGTVAVNSYIKIWPIGNATVAAVGPWS